MVEECACQYFEQTVDQFFGNSAFSDAPVDAIESFIHTTVLLRADKPLNVSK